MTTYKYSAISGDGKKVTGIVEGYSELDAVDRIRQDHDVILKITPVRAKKKNILSMEIGGQKLNGKAFTMMCSQFSIILRSGIAMSRATRLIAEKTTDKALKEILVGAAKDVEGGKTLSDSFADRGRKILPQVFIETIRAGEEAGNVESAFENMYQHYDKQTKMRAKIRNALSYPLFVIALAVVVVAILMLRVVPVFMNIFDSYEADLPAITLSLIAVSGFFRKYFLRILAVVILVVIGFKLYTSTEGGKERAARMQLHLPIIGAIAELNAASQFAGNLTTLLGAGIQITKAMRITSRVMGNYYISRQVGQMTGKLEEGRMLGDIMREADCFPDILVDMVAVGEESGELEDTLGTISQYYDSELQSAVSGAIGKMEPAVLLLVAGFAGYIVLAVYAAMFSMYNLM